uniref:Cyclin-dependent kinase 2-associated protein n=1 Tax=Xenopus tropicalis TaxID=8364 RepID=A0A6I8RRU7_XENTR
RVEPHTQANSRRRNQFYVAPTDSVRAIVHPFRIHSVRRTYLRIWSLNTGCSTPQDAEAKQANVPGAAVSSPSGAHSVSTFRPIFSDFGPPSMGFIPGVKPAVSQAVSQGTYSDLLSVIEEMGKEIRPTYAGSKSAMERLKRGIIHARALVRECLAETERNART